MENGGALLAADGAALPAHGAEIQPAAVAPKASLASAICNLGNTILGAGILGLPLALARVGIIPGLLMLVCFAALASLGLHLLTEAADRAGRPASFNAVAEAAIPGAGVLIDMAISIKAHAHTIGP